MKALSIIALIIKNWKHVVRFIEILERNIEKGINEKDLERGLSRLEKGFASVVTIQETADASRSINDAFRK